MCVQIIALYCQNRISKVCQQNVYNVTSCGTYTYQNPFNGDFVYPIETCLFSVPLVTNHVKLLCGKKICSLTLHEERSSSGSKQHDVEDKEWRKIHNMQRYNQFYSPFFYLVRQPPVGQGLLIHKVSR